MGLLVGVGVRVELVDVSVSRRHWRRGRGGGRLLGGLGGLPLGLGGDGVGMRGGSEGVGEYVSVSVRVAMLSL